MTTQHKITDRQLRKPGAHGFRWSVCPSTLVPNATYHTVSEGLGYGYARTDRGVSLLDPILLIRRNNNEVQRPVQPPSRTAQPFYLDVDGAPLGLHLVAVPFADRLEVHGPAIAEVQARPQHAGSLA